jgi:ribosomal-protein-alanine N-acetyltransferase
MTIFKETIEEFRKKIKLLHSALGSVFVSISTDSVRAVESVHWPRGQRRISLSRSNTVEEVPRLETKRLVLREMRPEDAEAIFALYGDEEVMRYRDVSALTCLQEAQCFLEQMHAHCEQGEEMHWGITLKGEEQLVGCCGYSWHLGPQFGAIGYDLARRYWKQGIMTEAIQELLRFGFEEQNLHRVEARVRLGNESSMRLLQRLGFQEEGLLRECLLLNNHFFDVKIFSLLQREYRKG